MRLHRLCQAGLLIAFLAVSTGCQDRPSRINQIDADPSQLARCMLEHGDKDHDNALSPDELENLPFLKCMASAYDSDSDGSLSEQEIASRFAAVVFDPRKALTPGECLVMRSGKPLAGAQVRLVPAECLTAFLPAARGTTSKEGVVRLTMEEENRPENAPRIAGLIRPGLYRIEVTHSTIAVPARFNTNTVLGAEASAATLVKGPIAIQLDF